MRRWVPVLLAPFVLLPACKSSDDAGASGSDSATGGSDGSGAGSSSDGGASTTGGASTGGSSGGPAPEPVLADGIHLTRIDANQGVAVGIADDGVWLDGAQRNAHLIANRRILIRAQHEIDPDFVPRDIEAKLTINYPDGTSEVASKVMFVDQASIDTNLETSFDWVLDEPRAQSGITFQVALYDAAPGDPTLPPPDPPPISPLAGPGHVGIEDSYMVLRVTLVPVHHDIGANCQPAPNPTEFELQIFHDQLYMHNPVELVEITVRDPYTYTGDLDSFGDLLGDLAQLRGSDGADPGEYYFGIVRPCDGGPDGVGGQAIDIPGLPSMGNGSSRVAVGRWYSSVQASANTFVHEIGHTQGRRHVECNGDEGGPDPSYPYPNGSIGVFGFGVLDFSAHNPTSGRDYMTYCGNTWVSDWGWEEVYPYIRTISEWDMGGALPPTEGTLLVGLLDERAAKETWFTVPGTLDPAQLTPGHAFELVSDGRILSAPARYGSMGDGGRNVMVQLPADVAADRLAEVTWSSPQTTRTVDIDRIRLAPRR